MIRIDARAGRLNIDWSEQECKQRQAVWSPPTRARLGGLLEKYAAVVGPANLGAVTHSGNVGWLA